MPKYLINTDSGYIILRHEYVHIKDCVNFLYIPFIISYLFILPALITFRAYWEYRAYCETLRVTYEEYGKVTQSQINFIVKQFTGSSYLWMFPFEKFLQKKFSNFVSEELNMRMF
jgi:hypothetical protein